jgi:ribosome-binding factor A
MTQRTQKIDELLRQEIGQALEREVTDPRIGFVTVTNVETAPDLSRARVWVSIIGSEAERKQTLTALRGAMPFIRRGLGSKIRLRRIPELDVRLDDSIERGTRVLQIINELEAGRTPDDIVARGESLPTPVPRLPLEGDTVEEPLPIPAVEPARKAHGGARRDERGRRGGGHGGQGHGGKGHSGPTATRRRPK